MNKVNCSCGVVFDWNDRGVEHEGVFETADFHGMSALSENEQIAVDSERCPDCMTSMIEYGDWDHRDFDEEPYVWIKFYCYTYQGKLVWFRDKNSVTAVFSKVMYAWLPDDTEDEEVNELLSIVLLKEAE